MNVYGWFYQLFIAVDQLLNVLVTPLHGSAWADETLSARAYRADRDGKLFGRFWRPVIDTLFFWQDQHCYGAWKKEQARLHSPPEQRP